MWKTASVNRSPSFTTTKIPLEQVTFTDGTWVAFDYDAQSQLVSAVTSDATPDTLADNPYKQYHYDNAFHPYAITGITNQDDERVHYMAYDEQGRATLSALGGYAERVDIAFENGANNTKVSTLRNALGKHTIYTYDQNNKPLFIEGHATQTCIAANQGYEYNDQGLVTRKTDWNDTITEYDYNDRGLETLRIEAVGTDAERTTETTWHKERRLPVKVVEANRTTFYTYNDQGLLIKQTVPRYTGYAQRLSEVIW